MNMMGFTPAVFAHIERHLVSFLELQRQTPTPAECLIPVVLGKLVSERAARVRVLPTSDRWFGVTHANDKAGATASIRELVERGHYPTPLWGTNRGTHAT